MVPDSSTLGLGSGLALSDCVVLSTTDAIRLCREGACEALTPRQAEGCLGTLDRRSLGDLRRLLARAHLAPVPLSSMKDEEVPTLLRTAIKDGLLTAVRVGRAGSTGEHDLTSQRRDLVRRISANLRALSFRGRTYKLVADIDVDSLPDRDSYEVAARDEAMAVLKGIAAEYQMNAELSRLLAQAADQLTTDWRPPFTADGLVLLRRMIRPQTNAKPTQAMTPSQMKKASTKTEWIEIQVADDLGKPYRGSYEIQLPDGTSTTGDFDGEGLWGNYDIDPGTCKLIKPDVRQAVKPDVALAEETIWVRLDIKPDDAAKLNEKFELTGSAGYQQVKTVKDDLVQGDAYVDLEFTGVDPNQRFTLRATGDDGEPHDVFVDLEFGQDPSESGSESEPQTEDPDSGPSPEEVGSEE
jgi:hypothetical protein